MRILGRDEARRYLVAHLGLMRTSARGAAGVRRTLGALRAVQLDPLDAIGTNADLVMLARVDSIARGDVYRATLPRHAFEHFAKERCLLPAAAFPQYRERSLETPCVALRALRERAGRAERVWRGARGFRPLLRVEPFLRSTRRSSRRPRRSRRARSCGPIGAAALTDHGAVEPLDWSGWKGTGRMTTMALEILWTRCQVVVAGRTREGGKLYDVPERALPDHHDAPAEPFERWALLDRVRAAGLLARAGGAHWSSLAPVRASRVPDELIEEGLLEEVCIEGARRPYLALAGLPAPRTRDDGRMRILGPLDPLLWDRKLVKEAFGFDYVWEVYKPKAERRFGWYVCPLLHRGRLVGRLEARIDGRALIVERLWTEEDQTLDEDALDAALERHAIACGADVVRRQRR